MNAPSDPLGSLVEPARGEKRLVVLGLTDPRSMREVMWEAFTRDIAPWAALEYEQAVDPHRVRERIEAGRDGAGALDVLVVANPASLRAASLLETFPQPFRHRYPGGWADEHGQWTPLYVQPVVMIHNRHYAHPPPRHWHDMVEPRWKNRLVFEEPGRMLSTGPALAELWSFLGAPAWEDWLNGIAATEPLIVADNERSVLEVAIGRCWIGLSNWNVALRVRPGSPVRYLFLNPTPCVPSFGALATGGRSPNLARLFLTWLSSPAGQQAYAATGRIPALPDVDAPTALPRILPEGVDPLFGSVSWLADPNPWVERFRRVLPVPDGSPRSGKLR